MANKRTSEIKNIILGLIVLCSCGCEIKREALGSDDGIFVIAAMEDEGKIKEILSAVLNDTLYTPKPEPYYKLTFVHPREFDRIKNSALVVVGAIGSDLSSPGVALVKRILSDKQYQQSISGEKPFIFTKDPFARNQIFMVINTPTVVRAKEIAKEQNEWIKQQFSDLFEYRQARFMFNNTRQKELETHLHEAYGWGIKIPWGYEVLVDSSEQRLFWIGREMPFRWLAVHWENGAIINDNQMAKQYIMNFPEEYFGSIRYSEYKFNLNTTQFNDWLAWRVTGIWEAIEDTQGGPFIGYLFYDGLTDKTYYIHTMIFHPGNNKLILLRQLEIIAKSFFVEKV